MSVNAQTTGYCTTWSGEGDAAAGTRQVATEIEFHTDIDEDGVELVSAHAAHLFSTITYIMAARSLPAVSSVCPDWPRLQLCCCQLLRDLCCAENAESVCVLRGTEEG